LLLGFAEELFHLLLSTGITIGIIIVVLATCCVAGCLLGIPYLGTVLFLPVLVFLRSYSACFLAQFGPDYDVFRVVPAPHLSQTWNFSSRPLNHYHAGSIGGGRVWKVIQNRAEPVPHVATVRPVGETCAS
jgi:hypothetical protein